MGNVRTVTSVAGFAAVAAAVLGMVLTRGNYPSIDDSPEQSRNRLSSPGSIVGLLLYVASAMALIIFATGLRRLVADAGAGWEVLATAGALLTATAVALSATGLGLVVASGWRVRERSAEFVRDETERFIFLNNLSALPVALGAFLLAGATLSADEPAAWTGWLGLLTAAFHVGIFISVARQGPLSPTGVFVLTGPPTYYVWVLAVAVVLL